MLDQSERAKMLGGSYRVSFTKRETSSFSPTPLLFTKERSDLVKESPCNLKVARFATNLQLTDKPLTHGTMQQLLGMVTVVYEQI